MSSIAAARDGRARSFDGTLWQCRTAPTSRAGGTGPEAADSGPAEASGPKARGIGVSESGQAGATERRVHISEKGMRLDRFMRIHYPSIAPGRLAALLKHGGLTVAGRRAKPTDRLAAGDLVVLNTPPEPPSPARAGARTGPAAGGGPAPVPLSAAERAFLAAMTVFEDDDLIVFDKPAGLAVHSGSGTRVDLDRLLVRMVSADGDRPVLVHRLDKDTSGLLVAVKRRPLAGVMGKAFATRRVDKEYRAVVAGVPPAEGLIDIAIRKVETSHGGRMAAAAPDDPDAQTARTGFRRLAVSADGTAALLALFPETGRTHQLRVHCALTGHPILGDPIYGDPQAAERLLLHAHRLAFRHPRTQTALSLEAPVPDAFFRAMERAPAAFDPNRRPA